jgi:hypothetical protein
MLTVRYRIEMSALPPKAEVGWRIHVGIWLPVYEATASNDRRCSIDLVHSAVPNEAYRVNLSRFGH